MGQPKYALKLGGRTFVDIAADALQAVTAKYITIVGDIDNRYLKLKSSDGEGHQFRNIPDVIFERDLNKKQAVRGALIGLYAALSQAESPWIAVLACDLPFVTGELMTRLAGYCSNEFDAVVPVQPDGQYQSLCAFYRRERAKPLAHKLFVDGDLKMQGFVSRLRTRFVEFEEIADLDSSANFFLNVNSQEDYKIALGIAPA